MRKFLLLALFWFSAVAYCGRVAETTQDGHKKIVVHEEAIIPTNTVTNTVTETAVVTQTVQNTIHATPVPESNTYTLRENEPLPQVRDDRSLLRRVVTDIWLRNGTFIHTHVKSSAVSKIAGGVCVVAGTFATTWALL